MYVHQLVIFVLSHMLCNSLYNNIVEPLQSWRKLNRRKFPNKRCVRGCMNCSWKKRGILISNWGVLVSGVSLERGFHCIQSWFMSVLCHTLGCRGHRSLRWQGHCSPMRQSSSWPHWLASGKPSRNLVSHTPQLPLDLVGTTCYVCVCVCLHCLLQLSPWLEVL